MTPILITIALAYAALGIGFSGAISTFPGRVLCAFAWPVLLFVALRRKRWPS
jgi:hypothetical protein